MDKSQKFITIGSFKIYSEAFKKKVVREVESNKLSKEQAKHKYHIGGNTTVLNWCRKYGKLNYFVSNYRITMPNKEVVEQALKQRIKELERELSDAKLKIKVHEAMIDIAEDQFGIDIRKKHGIKQSASVGKKAAK